MERPCRDQFNPILPSPHKRKISFSAKVRDCLWCVSFLSPFRVLDRPTGAGTNYSGVYVGDQTDRGHKMYVSAYIL